MKPKATQHTMFESELEVLLAEVSNDTNRIEVGQLRNWTVEYLSEYSAEVERFPEMRGVAHWNMFAMDDAGDDAAFALVLFEVDEFSIAVGRGRASEVRDFGENYDGNASSAIAAVKARVNSSTKVIRTAVQKADKWLGADG
ncbi:MAG: hypothetical protein AAF805_04875 [Planctomycetota bacterium]